MTKKQIIILLLASANIVSLIYLLGVGYYNNLLIDDYLFTAKVERNGIFGFIIEMYNTWQGRYGSFLLSSFFFKLSNHLFFVTIIQLVTGYISFYLFLNLLLKNKQKIISWLLSIFFINVSVMSLFEISTFYWLCASTYVMLIFLTFMLVWVIFEYRISNLIAYFLILILTFIIGGGAETYTPLIILVLGIINIYKLYNLGIRNFFFDKVNVRLLIVNLLLCVFFVIMLIAPGNEVRMRYVVTNLHFIHPTGGALILKTFRAMINLTFLIVAKSLYFILVFPLFYWLGSQIKDVDTSNFFLNKDKLKLKAIGSIILLFTFLWISLLPGVYAINDLMPLRSLSYVSFVMTFFFAYWGLVLGLNFSMNRIIYILIIIGLTSMITISATFSLIDIPKCKTYCNDIKMREKELLDLQEMKFKGVALIKPIVVSKSQSTYSKLWNLVVGNYKLEKKMNQSYFPYEQFSLSTDSKDYRNQGLKDYLDVDFVLVCDSSCIKN